MARQYIKTIVDGTKAHFDAPDGFPSKAAMLKEWGDVWSSFMQAKYEQLYDILPKTVQKGLIEGKLIIHTATDGGVIEVNTNDFCSRTLYRVHDIWSLKNITKKDVKKVN